MRMGDLVEFSGKVWLVLSVDYHRTMMAILQCHREQCEISCSLDVEEPETFKILSNPSEDGWQKLDVKTRNRLILAQNNESTLSVQYKNTQLTPYKEWFLFGTTLFVHPSITLSFGDTVLITGTTNSLLLRVPKKFTKIVKTKKPVEPQHSLLSEDDDYLLR